MMLQDYGFRPFFMVNFIEEIEELICIPAKG